MDNFENNDFVQEEVNVQRYRQRRVDGFKLNITEDSENDRDISSDSSLDSKNNKDEFSDEITSFSDETTRAQIEKDSKKALRRQKKEEKKIERIKSGRNKKIYRFAWLIMFIAMIVVAANFLITGANDLLAINRKDTDSAIIKVEKGDDIAAIARKLEDKGIIDSASFFTLFSVATNQDDEPIEPGLYQIPKNKDYLGILNHLQYTDNRQITLTVQITEGTNVNELADILYNEGVTYDKEEFLRLCNSHDFDDDFEFLKEIEDNEDRVYRLEGYLFPDTYEFYMNEAPDITIRRLLSNFEAKIYDATYEVEGYDEPVAIIDLARNSDFTLDEIVTLASLIQAEAADETDMYMVSSVINNRLSYGAQSDVHTLGLDCTEFYPYKSQEEIPEDIRDTFHSKYETYDTKGLPPGAVCSGGAQSFLSALVPAETEYLYFCHGTDSSGEVTAYYAVTFNEHINNMEEAGLS